MTHRLDRWQGAAVALGSDDMANMSYCRFRNTLEELRDCADYVEEDLSGGEHNARASLIRCMVRMLESIGASVDMSGADDAIMAPKDNA